MSLQSSLVEHLTSDATVSALVGTKVRPLDADKGDSLPYVVYTGNGEQRFPHMLASSGLVRASIQITSFDERYATALSIADAIREAMDKFQGNMGTGGNITYVGVASLQSQRDLKVPPPEDEEGSIYSVVQEWDFYFTETIPTF